MAARTVTVTCATDGEDPGVVRIDYSFSGGPGEPNRVRAFALHVSVDVGTIDAISDYKEGESSQHGTKGYGIFPGSIDLTDPENPDWNDPVAPDEDRGAEGTGLGTDTVILEMGSLYAGGDPNAPPASGTLCRLTVSDGCWMTIDEEQSVRGGIVLENPPGDEPDSTNLPSQCEIKVYCFPDTPDYAAQYADYLEYKQYNAIPARVDCWCADDPTNCINPPCVFQCDGDANGDTEGLAKYRVYGNDLALLLANWKKKITDPTIDPCADFDHDSEGLAKYRVYGNDLAILLANWKKKDSALPGDCPRPD